MPPEEGQEARRWVDRIVQRLQDRESPLRLRVEEILDRWVNEEEELTRGHRELIVKLLLGTLATPSFLVCNFPLDRDEVRRSLEDERATATQARDAADAVAESLARRKGSRLAYKSRVRRFLRHLVEDFSTESEREEVLQELLAADKAVVRHASGEVRRETRRRVLLGFNSPLLPEILVASEVLAEGLDLHLDCRHVIHHDLSWNPSTLEQRTGRVDRLRCLAEQEGRSIQVYLPYLEGTADEKMYRVVMDRMRWFQVIMGERYEVDERSTERLENRISFPDEAAKMLSFDLSISK
jgi:superfamily II DNA/RNA helicase